MASSSSSKSHWPLTLLGGAVSLANMFVPLALVRVLTPATVGQYKIFFLYVLLAPLFFLTSGITNGLSYWVGQDDKRTKAFRNSWTNLLAISTFVLLFGIVAYPKLLAGLGWPPLHLKLFIWIVFVQLLSTFFEEAAVAHGMIWTGALFTSGFDLARNMAMLGAALRFQTVESVFWANLIVVTIKVACSVVLGAQKGFQRFDFDPELRKAIWRYAFPVSLGGMLGIFLGYSDQLFLSNVIPPDQFAMYALGCLSVPPLLLLEMAVNRVVIPRMARAFAQGRSEQALKLLHDGTSELTWLFVPSAAGMIVFAVPIVKLLFGMKYLGAAVFLRVYALKYIVLGLPLDQVARARGRGGWILRLLLIFSGVSIAGVYLFGKLFGAIGAMTALIVIQYAGRLTATANVCGAEGWRMRDVLPWRDWIRYVSVALVSAGAAFLIRPYVDGGSGGLRWFLAGGALFSVIYMTGTIGTFLRRRLDSADQPQVLYLTQYLGLGGLERMILNLARGVKAEGKWVPSVIVYDDAGAEEKGITLHSDFKRSGIDVISLEKTGGGISLKVAYAIAREALRRRVSLVHSHDMGALIYAVLAKFITFGAIRIIHTQHSFIHLTKNKRYKHYERFFTMFVDEVTTVSESLQSQYSTVGIDPAKVKVIPNGVVFPKEPVSDAGDRLELRRSLIRAATEKGAIPALERNLDRVWVLCMARIHPMKGQEHVLAVWEALPAQERARAALIFVGAETSAGAVDGLKSRLASLNNPPEVIYAGFTLDPASWLKASDVSVSGSEFEGMPLGPLEALGSGLRVVVSDIPGHSMLPSSVGRFRLDEKRQGASLLAGEISAISDGGAELRAANWTAGESVRKNFGVFGMVGRYQDLYQRAL